MGRETAGILQNARDTADEITVQSTKRAEERLTEAEREAARLRSEAEAHIRALDAATDEIWVERRRIVDSTNKLGERLQTIAEEAASDFPADNPNGSKDEAKRVEEPAGKPGSP